MVNKWGKSGKSDRFYFGTRDTKITADGNCSHRIKNFLILGRKAMTNLERILKSKDITLLTKVHTVKAMIFPVVMYGCESWTIKKGWALKNLCFLIVVLKMTLESPLDCKEVKPVIPKGNQLRIFIGRTDWCWSWSSNTLTIWCWKSTHWKRSWCWEWLKVEGEGGDRMRWSDGIIDSMNMSLNSRR